MSNIKSVEQIRNERLREILSQPGRNPLDIQSVSMCRVCINLGEDHVPSEGSPGADVFILGQSPGATEVEQGRPFVGPSGELLDLMLYEAGLSRDEVYIANALKCRPPGNRKALRGELGNCLRVWLHKELAQVDPNIVILLGKDAFTTLMPPRLKFQHQGRFTAKSGRTYISLYHPSYFLRTGVPDKFITSGKFVRAVLRQLRKVDTLEE